jgi:chromosome segregation ATPase
MLVITLVISSISHAIISYQVKLQEASMDLEQLQKRLQWIEDDRRKERDALAMLENRLTVLEGSQAAPQQQLKDLAGEVTRISTVVSRMDQYDAALLQARQEAKRAGDDLSKEMKIRGDEAEKVRRVEIRSLENSLAELRKELELLPKLDKGLQSRGEDISLLRRLVDEVRAKIDEVRTEEQEYTRTFRLLEDGRRQDAKRIVDLQGEVTALRKRLDDQRGQTELLNTVQRKVEARLTELATVEAERRESMSTFLDKQALTQVERDRTWKEWQIRFETIEKQARDIEGQLLALDATNREVKRSQGSVDELAGRVERRINEITEIQRLSEDRFRQEWVTFKADDQKRWTNFTLTQEELRGEISRQFDKLAERSTQMEDELQEIKDLLQQTNEQAEKRLQALLAMAHEWVTTYERTVGRSR